MRRWFLLAAERCCCGIDDDVIYPAVRMTIILFGTTTAKNGNFASPSRA